MTICGYCGQGSHDRRDCPSELMDAGRWNEREWAALRRLSEASVDAMRYNMRMRDCPGAVADYAIPGRTFSE